MASTCIITSFLQALAHGFFNFDTFDVDEYEHYEVRKEHNSL